MPHEESQRHPGSVELVVTDLNGIARGKRIPRHELPDVLAHGLPMIRSLFALDIHGENVDEAGLAMATGDGDKRIVPVDGRVLPVTWSPQPLECVLMTMLDDDGSPWFADPRAVLARVLDRLRARGLTPVVALELEFYLIDRERTPDGLPQPPCCPATGLRDMGPQPYSLDDLTTWAPFLDGVTAALAAQDVETGSVLSEYAPGQFEINLHHHADALRAADEAVLLRRAVRGVARSQGMDATFLAKPYPDCSGSGLHLHLSLLDAEGRNLFEDAGALQQAVGGLLASMPEAMAIFVPNPNSFRRLQRGTYAPTVPTWGEDNRTVAIRVLGEGRNRRIEHRMAGADANPYLATAAVLAGVLHGIEKGVTPPPPVTGNAYEAPAVGEPLPLRPWDALDRFVAGTVLREHLGADYHRLYAACREAELRKFEAAWDRREMEWYLPVL